MCCTGLLQGFFFRTSFKGLKAVGLKGELGRIQGPFRTDLRFRV